MQQTQIVKKGKITIIWYCLMEVDRTFDFVSDAV